MFLYIDPIKQGLKQQPKVEDFSIEDLFLYIDPIKQGLKLRVLRSFANLDSVFIHRSNKTRIETRDSASETASRFSFYT